MGARVAVSGLFAASLALAQQIDTVILKSDAPTVSLYDEVNDPAERQAFEAVLAAREPQARLAAATGFLARYPASWLVGRAFEARAKAEIDLDRFDSALADGRQSLRIFPENVLLLAPLANVAIHIGRAAEAREHASRLLAALDRFTIPESIAEDLKASALTVLGRVALAEDNAAGAARHFEQALRLRPKEEQAAYLLARAYSALGRRDEARAWFAAVARGGGALAARARGEVAGDPESVPRPKLPPLAASKDRLAAPSTYAGSASCAECHAAQVDAWKKTGMAKMFRPYQREAVAGDFRNQEFAAPDGTLLARMIERDGRPAMELRGSKGMVTYAIDHLIGSKWQQGYVTRGSDGNLHVLPLQYNFERRRWINYWETIDPVHSVRADIGQFRAAGAATSYTRNCAPCHTSQLRAPDAKAAASFERSTFEEPGINCEMCHGPAAEHSKRPERVRPAVEFGKISAPQYVAVCAQCHMQSAVREVGSRGEMNFPGVGDAFPPAPRSRPYDQFLRRAFYKDGRFRETTFIVEAFERSRCFRAGGAHCGSCHHPHLADAAENPVSLKFRDRPDERCLQCHPQYRADPARHTRHAADAPASRCEACHMPRIMNALLFKAGTHTIGDIPRSDTAERFGVAESPNACLLCHTDKDARWLASQLSHWPRSQPPRRPEQ